MRTLSAVAAAVMAAGCVATAWAGDPRVKLAPNGAVLVEGKPFLPIMVWAQPMSEIGMHKELGVNTLHPGNGDKDPIKEYLDKLHANGMLALVNDDLYRDEVRGHPAILAWTVAHEPDILAKVGYEVDVPADGSVVWIEGESAKESTFKRSTWLDAEREQLSGKKWLTSDEKGQGRAAYEFEVKKAGTYTLWAREFNKLRANPTRWQIDDGASQETPRSLRPEEVMDMGGGQGVGWCRYGQAELAVGRHTLTVEIVPGRTMGGPDKPPADNVIWAADVFCFTTAEKYPAKKKVGPLPRRMPEAGKARHEEMKRRDPDCLTWSVLTGNIYGSARGEKNSLPVSYYTEFVKCANITGFDYYPVTGSNKPQRLPRVGLATREFVKLAGKGVPIWTIVEASDQELSWTAPETKGPTPEEMRAEVWMSIASGAKGIGYFTIAFGRGKKFQWNNLTDEIKAEMRRTNRELAELAAPIVMGDTAKALTVTGDETKDTEAEGHAIMAVRKEYEGKTYVIAVNVTRQTATPTFKLDAPPTSAAATVWKENRKVEAKDGAFSDEFKPLEVHVYVMD